MNVGAIAYARASTEELDVDVMTLAAQYDTVSHSVAERGWRLYACALDRGIDSSTPPEERSALGPALEDLSGGAAGALVVASLNRVSHGVRIWADLVERSHQQRWAIVVVEEGFELSVDGSEGAAALLAAAAREEQRWLSSRTRAGLAAAQAGGARLGRPVEHTPEARRLVGEMRAAGKTLQQIADHLTAEGIPTPRGGRWHRGTIHNLLRSARLDEQAAASATFQETGSTAKVATPAADEISLSADFDRRFPDSYNLS